MDNELLAKELNIPVGHVMVLSPAKRASYEHMIKVAAALNRGEWPAGVMVDGPRKRRRR